MDMKGVTEPTPLSLFRPLVQSYTGTTPMAQRSDARLNVGLGSCSGGFGLANALTLGRGSIVGKDVIVQHRNSVPVAPITPASLSDSRSAPFEAPLPVRYCIYTTMQKLVAICAECQGARFRIVYSRVSCTLCLSPTNDNRS